MKRKILDAIGMIIITITICIFSVIVGANEKGLRILPMSIILSIAIIYLISKKILLKEQIVIKNKIDIYVLLFMCVTLLPLIFKTYCTLQGTIEFILKYFFTYVIYLVVRNTVDSKRKVEIIMSVTIILSLVVIIFGIDLKNGKYLKSIIDKLNINYTEDWRLSSTFGYANTVAIYISFCIFLATHKIQYSKSKIVKILNIIYIILGFYTVYLTMSRAVIVILVFGLVAYLISYYLKNIIENKKKIIIFSIISIIVIAILMCLITIGLKYSKPLKIVKGEFKFDLRYVFEENHEYEIKLELEAPQNEEEQKEYEISIIEENIYRNTHTLATEKIEDFNGTKTYKITPSENLLRIKLRVKNDNEKEVYIKKCYINGEEYILEYKYIPSTISRLLKSFSLKEGSIYQRLDFYRYSLRIAKDNWIIGQGGNTWKELSQAVEDYPYYIKETHSYFFEILISYGIIGVILFLLVFIGFNVKIIKEYKKDKEKFRNKLAIMFGLNILILHSFLFDFNMSFLLIFLLVFIYMAILMYDSKEEIPKMKKIDYVVIAFLIVVLGVFISGNIAKYGIEDKKMKKDIGINRKYNYEYINEISSIYKDPKGTLIELQKFMKEEPYYNQSNIYKKYWRVLLKNINKFSEKELISYLKFINNQYRTIKFATPMYINTILERVGTMQDSYTKLKKMNFTNQEILEEIKDLKKIVEDEYKINIVNIKDKNRNGSTQKNIDEITKRYSEILKEIK